MTADLTLPQAVHPYRYYKFSRASGYSWQDPECPNCGQSFPYPTVLYSNRSMPDPGDVLRGGMLATCLVGVALAPFTAGTSLLMTCSAAACTAGTVGVAVTCGIANSKASKSQKEKESKYEGTCPHCSGRYRGFKIIRRY